MTDTADEFLDYGTPSVSYTRGNDLSGSLEGAGGIGGLLARTAHSGTNLSHAFYHADGNGNITCMVDTNQTVVAQYRYDPFGNTISQSGTLASANAYRFSSKEITSAGYYYGYRFYDPYLQRWLNRDPLQERGGYNLYEFGHNNPASFIDPFGLEFVLLPIDPRPPSGGGISGPTSGSNQNNPAPFFCPKPDCTGHYEPYWQIMGYASQSSCATAEWDLNRDTVAGGLGIIGGTIIGGWPGGVIGGVGAGIMIPNAICAQSICVP